MFVLLENVQRYGLTRTSMWSSLENIVKFLYNRYLERNPRPSKNSWEEWLLWNLEREAFFVICFCANLDPLSADHYKQTRKVYCGEISAMAAEMGIIVKEGQEQHSNVSSG